MVRVALLLLPATLFGCVGTHDGDSAAAGPAVDPPPCALSQPWAMDAVEDVALAGALAYPGIGELIMLDGDASNLAVAAVAAGDTCLAVTESEDGAVVSVAGDCTTAAGDVFAGAATFSWINGSNVSSYSHFEFIDGYTSEGYVVDGGWESHDGVFSFDLTLSLVSAAASGFPGAVVSYQTVITFWAAGQGTVEGRADIQSLPGDSATGDLCVAADIDALDECDLESKDAMSLWGSTPATIAWQGADACDGCADVTIDGADAGVYCSG